jgi:hypothetical protein
VTGRNDAEGVDVFATSLSGNDFPDGAMICVSLGINAQRVTKTK